VIIRKGEVITIASGWFEKYDRAGPFVAVQDIDIDAFVAEATDQVVERPEIQALLRDIPKMMLERGLIALSPCRRIFLGVAGDIEIGEEKDEI
jgi:hypothetical protein